MSKTRNLVIIVFFLLVFCYVHLYTKIPDPPYEIIQLDLSKLTQDILNQKQPIIINDLIINVNALVNTVFAYQYMMKDERFIKSSDLFTRSVSKYTILTSPFHNATIDIATPDTKDTQNLQYTTIKMAKNKVMILPPKWLSRTQDEKIKRIILDDPITAVVYRF